MSATTSCTLPHRSAAASNFSMSISDGIPGAAPHSPWATSPLYPPWTNGLMPYDIRHGALPSWQPHLTPAPYQTGQKVEFPGSLPPVPHLPPHGILPTPMLPAAPLSLEEIQRILAEAERLQGSVRRTDGGDAADASPGTVDPHDSGEAPWPPLPTSLAEELFDA